MISLPVKWTLFLPSGGVTPAAGASTVVWPLVALIPLMVRILSSSTPLRGIVVEIELVTRDGRLVILRYCPIHFELVPGRSALQHSQLGLNRLDCRVLSPVSSTSTPTRARMYLLGATQSRYFNPWPRSVPHFVVIHILRESYGTVLNANLLAIQFPQRFGSIACILERDKRVSPGLARQRSGTMEEHVELFNIPELLQDFQKLKPVIEKENIGQIESQGISGIVNTYSDIRWSKWPIQRRVSSIDPSAIVERRFIALSRGMRSD